MGLYGASFVLVTSDPDGTLSVVADALEERNRAWLAASPEHLAGEHTVRLHAESLWLSIENAAPDDVLQQVSARLSSEALTLYAIDEHRLEFQYRHWKDARLLRALDYLDDPNGMGTWTRVEGDVESWEAVLFQPTLLALYDKHAPEREKSELRKEKTIVLGSSIPWPCDGTIIDQLARQMHLPWQPLQNTFLAPTRARVVPGSPKPWKRFRREHGLNPWWRFW